MINAIVKGNRVKQEDNMNKMLINAGSLIQLIQKEYTLVNE